MNAIVEACKFVTSPKAFILHERKQVVIQFLIENSLIFCLHGHNRIYSLTCEKATH